MPKGTLTTRRKVGSSVQIGETIVEIVAFTFQDDEGRVRRFDSRGDVILRITAPKDQKITFSGGDDGQPSTGEAKQSDHA